MDSQVSWDLFWATGLPEAYNLHAWLRDEEETENSKTA